MIPSDYHVHTHLCKHAVGQVQEYLAAAKAKGIREIAFTDHAPTPDGFDARNRMIYDQYPIYEKMLEEARLDKDLVVRYGIEADFYPGCEQYLYDWLKKQNFDLVMGSIHFIGTWGFDDPDRLSEWANVDVKAVWREYLALVIKLADSGRFDVLGHPDLPKKFGHRLKDSDSKEMVQPALDRIAKAGMAIEINTSGLRRAAKEQYPSHLILELARERDIPITFGSDSHCPEHVGYEFEQAVSIARECGYTHYARFLKREKISEAL